MDLDKTSSRGSFKMALSSDSRVAAFQWSDSKIVNCMLSYLHFGVSSIQRQRGSTRQQFLCPSALVHYQHNMGAVDKVDQIRKHFGGLAAQAHFKKWYKKTLMAVMDCMLVNGLIMWNLSTERIPDRRKMTRYEFLQVVAHALLIYKTELLVSPVNSPVVARRRRQETEDDENSEMDHHESIECVGRKPRCIVCNLEVSQYLYVLKTAKKESLNTVDDQLLNENRRMLVKRAYDGLRWYVAMCQQCGVFAHTVHLVANKKFIHNFFPGRTCMQILHSTTGREIWKIRIREKKKVSVNYKHPIIAEVRRNVNVVMMAPL
jgi:hypothetical protein